MSNLEIQVWAKSAPWPLMHHDEEGQEKGRSQVKVSARKSFVWRNM
jgi:hypothetical protein